MSPGRLITPALVVLLAGCASLDGDGDGLPDSFERQIGTDPSVADSDGDGYDDGTEYLSYFRPDDPDDHPIEGNYPRAALPDEIEGEGWDEGDVSEDWLLRDQHGDSLHLHDFYGNVVLIHICTDSGDSCQQAASELQLGYEERRERGFVVLSLLVASGEVEPDVDAWVDNWGITYPVFADIGSPTVHPRYVDMDQNGQFTVPSYSLLARDLEIEERNVTEALDWALVDDLLDTSPPDVDWPLPGGDTKPASDGEGPTEDPFGPGPNETGYDEGAPFGGVGCSLIPHTSPSLLILPTLLLPLRRRH